MKLFAKVKFKQDEIAGQLVREFFQEFNPENSILIKKQEAKIEMFFN